MIPESDIWRAALAMVKRYGADAEVEAAIRVDELLDEGDTDGAGAWQRITNAIERLQLQQLEPEGVVNRAEPVPKKSAMVN